MTITEEQMNHYTGLTEDAKRWAELREVVLRSRDVAREESSQVADITATQALRKARYQGSAAAFQVVLDLLDSMC